MLSKAVGYTEIRVTYHRRDNKIKGSNNIHDQAPSPPHLEGSPFGLMLCKRLASTDKKDNDREGVGNIQEDGARRNVRAKGYRRTQV